jgi:hypothetical protein
MDQALIDQSPTVQQYVPTLMDQFRRLGICGPIYLLIAIILLVWISILLFRAFSGLNYVAYLAATLFPLVLGITLSLGSFIHYFMVLSSGGFGPGNPNEILGETLLPLAFGSLLTSLFFPLGLLAFLLRKRE